MTATDVVVEVTSSARPRPHVVRGAPLRAALGGMLADGRTARGVRAEIGDSWQRSAAAGLQPDQLDAPFDAEIARDAELLRAARPVLDELAVDIGDTPVAVVLCAANGQIIERRVGDPNLVDGLDRLLFAPGFVYAEDTVGTNGIGTALALRRPVLVNGHEHFADPLTSLVCAAAPIWDLASGHIRGVLDLTCPASDANALMLPFATRAARQIEERLVDDAAVTERLVLQRFLHERRRAKGPVVLVTERTLVTNAAADRLVESRDETVLRDCAEQLLEGSATEPVTIVLGNGTEVAVHGEAADHAGTRLGVVLRLVPVADAHTRDRSFGWDSLTDTERSVAELVADGLTNREAAERLFLSHHTVGFHLRSIFRKLDLTSRVELTRVVVERGT